MISKRRQLGEILYRKGYIDKESLIEAIKSSKKNNQRLGQTLIDLGLVSEENVTRALAKQFGIEYVDLDPKAIPENVMKLVPEELMKRHKIVPISLNNGKLKLAITDPLDLDTLDLVRFRLNCELDCCLACPSKINGIVNKQSDQLKEQLKNSIDVMAEDLAAAGASIGHAHFHAGHAHDPTADRIGQLGHHPP
jgi:type IV pilus assembly protein PilB